MLTSPPVPPVAPALLPPWAPLASMQIEPGTAFDGDHPRLAAGVVAEPHLHHLGAVGVAAEAGGPGGAVGDDVACGVAADAAVPPGGKGHGAAIMAPATSVAPGQAPSTTSSRGNAPRLPPGCSENSVHSVPFVWPLPTDSQENRICPSRGAPRARWACLSRRLDRARTGPRGRYCPLASAARSDRLRPPGVGA